MFNVQCTHKDISYGPTIIKHVCICQYLFKTLIYKLLSNWFESTYQLLTNSWSQFNFIVTIMPNIEQIATEIEIHYFWTFETDATQKHLPYTNGKEFNVHVFKSLFRSISCDSDPIIWKFSESIVERHICFILLKPRPKTFPYFEIQLIYNSFCRFCHIFVDSCMLNILHTRYLIIARKGFPIFFFRSSFLLIFS